MVLLCTLGLVSVGHTQTGGGGGIPGTTFGGATDPSNVQIADGFHVIPAIGVAERYDSNVFFAPKSPGLDRSDYVTTVVPQIRGLYGGEAMRVNATVGATAEYYVKNTDFNYVGANAALALDPSPMLDRLWKGMTGGVVERFRYTPQAPSFQVGNQEGDTSNPFQSGQQVGRVNTTSNTVSATVTAPFTQTLGLTATYFYGFLRFGSSDVQPVGALLDSSYQSFTGGMTMRISPQDVMALTFIDTEYRYEQGGGSFSSRGGVVGWTHAFSPAVALDSSAGATILEGQTSGSGTQGAQGQTSGSSNIPPTVAPRGRIGLTWSDRTTSLAMVYGVGIVQSYQFGAQPMLADTVSLSVTQITPIPELVGVASVNYGRGDEYGSKSVNSVSYVSYAASGGVLYKFTPQTFLNLSYQYGNFDNQFGATTNSFDRHFVAISVAQAFY